MAVNVEVKSGPWRSPLSTPIRKDDRNTKDTFQHLEKLLASAVSICRLKGTLECQTGGLITVCEEMQRLLRYSFSEITRLEKEVRKLQKHHEEELICFSKRITCIEQEKDAVKKVMENLTRRPDNAAGTDRYALLEQIEQAAGTDSQDTEATPTVSPNDKLMIDRGVSEATESSECDADCGEFQEREDSHVRGKNKQAEENKASSKQQERKSQAFGMEDVGNTAVDVSMKEILQSQPLAKKKSLKRLSSKKTGKPSHKAFTNSSASGGSSTSDNSKAEQMSDEEGNPSLTDDTSQIQSAKRKLKISRKSKKIPANKMKNNLKNPQSGSPAAKCDNSEVVIQVVEEDKMEMEVDAMPAEKSGQQKIKDSPSTGPQRGKAYTREGKESAEPLKEKAKKMQEVAESSSHPYKGKRRTPVSTKSSKRPHEDEPLGDMSFLLDVNLKISEFVTSSEQELELQLMTGRQRTDVYKLAELYKVRARMGNKCDNLTTLGLSKTPESRMPKNGRVDCLLSKLSIAATREAERESPKMKAGKRKQLQDAFSEPGQGRAGKKKTRS